MMVIFGFGVRSIIRTAIPKTAFRYILNVGSFPLTVTVLIGVCIKALLYLPLPNVATVTVRGNDVT